MLVPWRVVLGRVSSHPKQLKGTFKVLIGQASHGARMAWKFQGHSNGEKNDPPPTLEGWKSWPLSKDQREKRKKQVTSLNQLEIKWFNWWFIMLESTTSTWITHPSVWTWIKPPRMKRNLRVFYILLMMKRNLAWTKWDKWNITKPFLVQIENYTQPSTA